MDARAFKTDNDLMECFIPFEQRENELRNYLESFMPDYIQRAHMWQEICYTLFRKYETNELV